MTSSSDPSELASALVDGLLPADEAAQAAADPEVAALAAELEDLRSEIRTLPAAPDIGRAMAAAAALESVGHLQPPPTGSGLQSGPGPTPAPVLRPPGRRTRQPWLVAVAGAAASVLLLVLAVGLFSSDGDDDTASDMAATPAEDEPGAADAGEANREGLADSDAFDADEQADEEAEAAEDGFAEPPSAGEAPTAESPPENDDNGGSSETVHLGTVDGIEELITEVRNEASPGALEGDRAEGTDQASGSAENEGCPAYGPAGNPSLGDPNFAATAFLDGEHVWVHLYPLGGNQSRLVVTNSSCETVVARGVEI